MQRVLHYITLLSFLFTSCEQEIELDIPASESQIVVEGYIENDRPPFVILTKSSPFFSSLSAEQIEESFIHDATVTVTNGSKTETLLELATDTLPEYIESIEQAFGIEIDLNQFLGFDITALSEDAPTFYVYTSFGLFGEELNQYDLKVETEGKVVTSTTTIPKIEPIDSMWVTPHPNEKFDSLVLLNVRFQDPPNVENYVRYFTSRNKEPFYPGYFQSVFDDRSVLDLDGELIDFTVERGYGFVEDIDFDTFSYFIAGDTIRMRWCMIDKAHYDFWSTLEFDQTQAGNPFGRPTIIKTNIKGGLGYWGGYAASYHELITEPFNN